MAPRATAPRWLALACLAAAAAMVPPLAAGQPDARAGDARDVVMFRQWVPPLRAEVREFEVFLARAHAAGVVPSWQLLRSASMWQECGAPPFALPPRSQWGEAAAVVALLKELRRTGTLGPFAVMSAYRSGALNQCAGGAPRSAHLRFAVDVVPLAPTAADAERLCNFWRVYGRAWDMGLGHYPGGRIHIDRTGWRTWGAEHVGAATFCQRDADPRRPGG